MAPIRHRQQRHGSGILIFWGWEMASLVAAAGIVAAIVSVLAKYDDHEIPKLPYNIRLNTLMALLTLCLRAALVAVAAEVIGQSKWIWYSDGPRPLANFQTFDEASRGLLGSVKLISLMRLSYRGSPLAVIAAITTILSLAISPFTQQAIKTVSCARLASQLEARVPIAIQLPGADGSFSFGNTGGDLQEPGPKVQAAIFSGFTHPNGNDSAIQWQCPTGNCTFPETLGVSHSTTGLCVQCLDTTSLMNVSWQIHGHDSEHKPFNQTNSSLGDLTLSLDMMKPMLIAGAHMNLSFADSIMSPGFKDVVREAFANVSVMTYSRLPGRDCGDETYNQACLVAATCSLYPCMKDLRVTVINGRLEERVVNTVPARSLLPPGKQSTFNPDLGVVKSPCLVDGRIYDTTNFSLIPMEPSKRKFVEVPFNGQQLNVSSDCLYTIRGDYSVGLRTFFEKRLFSGACKDTTTGRDYLACDETWWLHQFYDGGTASFDSINTVFQQVATATTNFFRADGWGPFYNRTVYKASNDSRLFKTFLMGEVHETTICVRLEWPWLLLPGLLCLTTMALLVAMLFVNARNSHRPVWKSSTLPLLFWGIDARQARDGVLEGASSEDLKSLHRQAESTTATLELDSDLSRTVLVNADEPKAGNDTETSGGADPAAIALR